MRDNSENILIKYHNNSSLLTICEGRILLKNKEYNKATVKFNSEKMSSSEKIARSAYLYYFVSKYGMYKKEPTNENRRKAIKAWKYVEQQYENDQSNRLYNDTKKMYLSLLK